MDDITRVLAEKGYTISDFLRELGAENTTLVNLSRDQQAEFDLCYDQLVAQDYNQYTKGKLLEKISAILFDGDIFRVIKNCRTSTNEIDLLVDWTEKARLYGLNQAFPCIGERVLCECKNYTKPVSVTYVGKFASLLCVTKADIGIMISWEGVTGRGWQDGSGLIKKLALAKECKIVVIDREDLKRIRSRDTCILNLIHEKDLALLTDIDYRKYIVNHEAEVELQA